METSGTAEHPALTESAAAELRRVGAELAERDRAIGEFKRQHMVTINGRQCFQSADPAGRPALDAELRRLFDAREKAWRVHQEAMKQWAEIKMQRGAA